MPDGGEAARWRGTRRSGGHGETEGGENTGWVVRGLECGFKQYVLSLRFPTCAKHYTSGARQRLPLEKRPNRPFLFDQLLTCFKHHAMQNFQVT
jgi:hypothetical protein